MIGINRNGLKFTYSNLYFAGIMEEKTTLVCKKTISNVTFSLLICEWASITGNVKEIIASLFDFLKDNFSIISSLVTFL
jgi:hypothetical protein